MLQGVRTHYFAYGSNMSSVRLGARVNGAVALGCAELRHHRLVLTKLSHDGSGKANVQAVRGDSVWGVVYELDDVELLRLDRFEAGYARHMLRVSARDGGLAAAVYVSSNQLADGVPFDWYKRMLLTGALEHGLPETYTTRLRGLPDRADPRRAAAPA